MTIQAPAKVNLALRILAKRPDGYHDIETLMVPISLADEIEIGVSEGTGIDLQCDDPEIPAGPGNLVWRAAEVFQRHTRHRFHTKIHLRKKIPHGAGLGGGSSDAAAVLKALDQLRETRLGPRQLEALAATLGSDAAFFVRSRPALCRGRGELMQDAGGVPSAKQLLLKPPFPVSTAWAYQAWSARSPVSRDRQFHGTIELANDFEEPVFRKYLLLPAIKSWLLEQDEVAAAMMSGSGSTIFAILRRDAGTLAQRAKDRFGRNLWTSEAAINCC
ncbi:MAG: 4-(cytidine 5'-diphospho)-2-C-methyl-D-erythritol kinase [Terrimicrobiaceae bacterium]|nr:4-(cytidine 5'-diphospho)-2-C-methyl-D-erythritol kinase [Terrimicrobiaceae bacterium]